MCWSRRASSASMRPACSGVSTPSSLACGTPRNNRFVPKRRVEEPRRAARVAMIATRIIHSRETIMPRGDKSSYTDKQKRQAEHIEEDYEDRGVAKKEAERRGWATVNKETGGGNKSGSGRVVPDTNVSAKRGGRIGGPRGGKASANPPAPAPARSANKAATTRKRPASVQSRPRQT